MKDKNANWQKIIDKISERIKIFLSSEKVDKLENTLAQVQQQVGSLQEQLEGVNSNLKSQIAEAVQQQLTQISSSKIDSLENSIAQLQQQVGSLEQQLENTTTNIQNQIEEAVRERLTQLNESTPASPQIQLKKTTFAPGEEIQVSFVALPSFTNNAWIGIIPSYIPHGSQTVNDQHDLSYHYLHKQISGNLVFKAPNQEGSYDLRMNDSGKEVTSTSFSVAVDLSGVQLQLNKTTFAPAEEIQVSFVASPSFASNAWVGIIPSNIPHGSEAVNDSHDLSYQYLSGRTSGTLLFKAPNQEGSYDLRMNGSGKEGTSTSFSVAVDLSGVQLQLNKTTFSPGEEIQVSFAASSSFASNAWVGIIPSNIPHGSQTVNDQHDLSYQYLSGRTSGTLLFKAPNQEGSYDLRMNGSGKEVTSTSFSVAVDLSGVQLQLNKTALAPGEEIQLSFVASSSFASNAWVGIIPSHIPHGSEAVNDSHDLSYQYLSGCMSGTLLFKAPMQIGSYDLRMHDTDFNGREVCSVSFDVIQKELPNSGSILPH
jgi:hypothetical protein